MLFLFSFPEMEKQCFGEWELSFTRYLGLVSVAWMPLIGPFSVVRGSS